MTQLQYYYCHNDDIHIHTAVYLCQPVRQEFMENECEALPRVAYPGVRDNRSTVNTKTGYDDMMMLNRAPYTLFPPEGYRGAAN